MMDKVFFMKRKTKGAISVFLILIFVATYMISGLLVDGGRYRMAKVMAETSLDTAAESVLSQYNQMLYDLYGLFAVDSASVTEKQIAEVLENYVTQTLNSTDIDYSGYSTLLSNWLLEGDWKPGEGVDYFNDYDFEVDITAGSSVTLASTDYVEDQIVDHMKYRAPIELVAGADSFLNKLQGIVDIKNRMLAAKDQISVTNSHKDLFKECDTLMKDLNAFNEKMIAFCNNPCGNLAFSSNMVAGGEGDYDSSNYNKENAVDLYEKFGKTLDDKLAEIGNYTPKLDLELSKDGVEIFETAEELRARQETDYEKAKNSFFNSMQPMFTNAFSLYNEANSLRDRITTVNSNYNQYIADLQKNLDAHAGDAQYETVYKPEIALAKSNCGEILKNVDLLLSSRKFTDDIYKLGQSSNWSSFETAVGGLIDHRLNGGSPASLKAALDAGSGGGWAGETAMQFFADAQGDLQALMSQTSYFYKCHKMEVNVINGDDTVNTTAKADKEEKNKVTPKDLNAKDVKVAYTVAGKEDGGDDFKLDNSVDTKKAENILNAGLSLVDTLANMLEGVRDSIYVNEYIMTTFPNVVDAKETPKDQSDLEKMRAQYNATVAGVEYILIGKTDSSANVLAVDAELLGIRTIFNTVAIFTDTAKRNQASSIAAAISGPFAPIVTIALLIAWAVAESALDVVDLKNGEDVVLFKTGSDWTLSVEGAVKKCISKAAQAVGDEISDRLSSVQEEIKKQTNEVIYDVYNGVNSGISGATGAVKSKLSESSNMIKNNAGNVAEVNAALDEMNGALNAKISEVETTLTDWTGEEKDKVIKTVNESVDSAFDKVDTKLKNGLNKLSDKAMKKVEGMIPIGKVTDTGDESKIKLNYNDYLRILLLMMNQQTKVQRIQSYIQASMIHGGNKNFKMENSAVAIWADMDCSIRYLFMTNSILPEDVKRQGRMTFTVHSARSY